MSAMPAHTDEPHTEGGAARLNSLRAGVLGADDGIVSVAGLVAAAVSMALGEYVSVSSQRDSEQARLAMEKCELRESPKEELEELAALHRARGLWEAIARQVAVALTDHDALTTMP